MAGIRYIYCRKEDLPVGQRDFCDVIIDDAAEYDDDVLAYFVSNQDGESWRLVRGADDVRILVNGEPLHLVHYLTPGDRLIFGSDKTVYRFAGAVREETEKKNVRIVSAAIFAFLLLAVTVVASIFRTDPEDDIHWNEIRRYRSSVFKVTVREVLYQSVSVTDQGVETDTLGICRLGTSLPSGTGFLCTDGRFVTARHCLEPWIVNEFPDSLYRNGDDLTVWAADAETFNVIHGSDSSYRRLVSICEVSGDAGVLGLFSSDTCFMNTEYDLVRNMRGTADPLYWRELGHIRSRSSLGDVAFFRTGYKGRLDLADAEYIDSLHVDVPVVHVGYPVSHGGFGFERSRLFIQRQKNRCLEFNDTDVEKGYSGGPALVRRNGRLCVVGVLSRILSVDKRRCFCVPVNEIDNAEKRWERLR